MGWVQRSGQLRLRHRRGGGVDRRLCVGVRVVGGAVDGDGSLRMADTRDQTNEKRRMCVNMDEVGCAGRLIWCAGHAPLAVSARHVVQEVDATSNLGHVPLHGALGVNRGANAPLLLLTCQRREVRCCRQAGSSATLKAETALV
jgi:hypothetical protein